MHKLVVRRLQARKQDCGGNGSLKNDKYGHNLDRVNSRLDSIQAAVLNYGHPKLDQWKLESKEIPKTYNAGLNLKISTSALHNYVYHHFDVVIANCDSKRSN